MKREKKTYGVIGMMEFQAVIKVGRNNMKIPFTDGSLSAMGNNPARFTTDSYMVQHAIENSTEFKRGLIRLLNAVDLPGEVKVERNASKAMNDPIPKEMDTDGTQKPVSGERADETSERTEGVWNMDETGAEDAKETASETGNTGGGLKEVEVSCNDDAKDYLEKHFGVVRSKLRNRETIVTVAATNGIEFVFV